MSHVWRNTPESWRKLNMKKPNLRPISPIQSLKSLANLSVKAASQLRVTWAVLVMRTIETFAFWTGPGVVADGWREAEDWRIHLRYKGGGGEIGGCEERINVHVQQDQSCVSIEYQWERDLSVLDDTCCVWSWSCRRDCRPYVPIDRVRMFHANLTNPFGKPLKTEMFNRTFKAPKLGRRNKAIGWQIPARPRCTVALPRILVVVKDWRMAPSKYSRCCALLNSHFALLHLCILFVHPWFFSAINSCYSTASSFPDNGHNYHCCARKKEEGRRKSRE